jgi:ABC-type thiamine transport system ATPase subunit
LRDEVVAEFVDEYQARRYTLRLEKEQKDQFSRSGTTIGFSDFHVNFEREASMNRLAKRLVALAESLVARIDIPILDKASVSENRKLWSQIKDVANDIADMADEDDEGTRSNTFAKSEAKKLASKYLPWFSGAEKELESTILEYIWETYHNLDL